MEFSPALLNAIDVAREAGQTLLDSYEAEAGRKGHLDEGVVTRAAQLSELTIFTGLKAKYGWPVMAKQSRDIDAIVASDYLWIVDPLDGRDEFTRQTGDFSVLIGLVYQQEPILGVVYVPTKHKIYCAEKDKGAFTQLYNRMPRRIQVSATADLSKMTLALSRSHVSEGDVEAARSIRCEYVLRVGSVGHKLALIAEGAADFYINTRPQIFEWDTCAARIILAEAGGTITDTHGGELLYRRQHNKHHNGIVASNGKAHQKILEKVGEIVRPAALV